MEDNPNKNYDANTLMTLQGQNQKQVQTNVELGEMEASESSYGMENENENDKTEGVNSEQWKDEREDSENEDNLPLIHFSKRKLFSSPDNKVGNFKENIGELSDDSTSDPLYTIKETDLCSSDSNDNADLKEVQKLLRKRKKERGMKMKSDKILRTATMKNIRGKITQNQLKEKRNKFSGTQSSRVDSFRSSGNNIKHKPSTFSDKMKRVLKDKAWNKTPTCLNKIGKNIPGRPKHLKQRPISSATKSPNKEILMAKRASLSTFKRKQLVFNYHISSLDAILSSNGLKRTSVTGDGNCFFKSIQKSCQIEEDIQSIRQTICDHMEQHEIEYIHFLQMNPDVLEREKEDIFLEQVDNLRKNANWSSDLGDALPLAAANTYQMEILIYTSRRENPVIEVQPTLVENPIRPKITLAYIAATGYEHYDMCEPIGKYHTPLSPITQHMDNLSISPKFKKTTLSSDITPRKQANYVSPKRKVWTRKRKSNPHAWKKNIRKNLRLAGKEYSSTSGKVIPAKKLLPVPCTKCRFHCSERVTDIERQHLFDSYWNLNSHERKKDFLCSSIIETLPEKVSATSHRSRSRSFFLNCGDRRVRVCKAFFMKTLNIGRSCIDTALVNRHCSTSTFQNQRSRKSPHNKTPKAIIDKIKDHIESFPVMEPHYTRKDTQRKFLGCDLSIRKLYSLYKEECRSQGRKAAGPSVYWKVFCENYNFSFHQPKKDQCQTCTLYMQKVEKGDVTDSAKEEYDMHIKRKIRAREEKNLDKKFASTHSNYHSATFDLEAVMPIPCSNVSQVYYKRKLSCYKLSFYSLGNSKGTFFLWNETEGKRGSNEVGSCLQMYLKGLPSIVDHVCFYSDCCAGQNRNRFIVTALLNAVSTIPNINVVDHKYLETGHTQMECDSMHAAIEHAKKNTSIFVPSQYDTIVRMARTKNKYRVVPLKHQDFVDFKRVSKRILPNNMIDCHGEKVHWMHLRWIQFRKSDTSKIYFKYNFDDEEFTSMRIKTPRGANIVGPMPRCYKGKLPISEAKKNDLVSLCKSNVIPEEFHTYFANLPSDKSLEDCLSTPDAIEEANVDSD